jgi:hypothetical protein
MHMGADCAVRADFVAAWWSAHGRGRARGGWRRLAGLYGLLFSVFIDACSFDRQPLFVPPEAPKPSDQDAAAVELAGSGGTPATPIQTGAAVGDETDAGRAYDGDAGGDAARHCRPGAAMSCKDGMLQRCRADGQGYERSACGALGCDAAGQRCNECAPNQLSCREDRLTQCGADGRVAREEVCAMGCGMGPGGAAACNVCKPDSAQCRDTQLLRCRAGQWQTTACTKGCDQAVRQCVERKLVPANLRPDICQVTASLDHVFAGEIELNTDDDCDEVVTQQPGVPEICVHIFAHILVAEGATVRARGKRALALVATETLRIDGTLSVSAIGATSGAGSVLAGPGIGAAARAPAGAVGLASAAGGGGGGHATRGAPGGAATERCDRTTCSVVAGAGGVAYGDATLAPLIGGAAGGRNGAGTITRRDAPGGGGGALQLVACGQLMLGATAVLEANGGGGGGGVPAAGAALNDGAGLGAGAGGGSGGVILIQARTATLSAAARLVANGGGGGGASSGTGQAGQLRAGQPGDDGQRNADKARGGLTADDARSGGSGGTREPPEAGLAAGRLQAAGGGGGAAGRIRIELGSGPPKLDGLVVSPGASAATVRFE